MKVALTPAKYPQTHVDTQSHSAGRVRITRPVQGGRMKTYMLWFNNAPKGPTTLEKLKELLAAKKISSESLVIEASKFHTKSPSENVWVELREVLGEMPATKSDSSVAKSQPQERSVSESQPQESRMSSETNSTLQSRKNSDPHETHFSSLMRALKALAICIAAVWAIAVFASYARHAPGPSTAFNSTQHNQSEKASTHNQTNISSQLVYNETDAIKDIALERQRYDQLQRSSIKLIESDQEMSKNIESKKKYNQIINIESMISSNLNKRILIKLNKPNRPIIFTAGISSRNEVLEFVNDYRKWGTNLNSLYKELFRLEDEKQRLQDGANYQDHLIGFLEIGSRPMGGIYNSMLDQEIQDYSNLMELVEVEQWELLSETLEARRRQVGSYLSNTNFIQPEPISKPLNDIARGPWRVLRIVDGDTIVVTFGNSDNTEKIRLLNINTPEKGEPGHDEASNKLSSLLENSSVQLEFVNSGSPTRDPYDRILAFVFVNDIFVNYEMVKSGWSEFFTKYGRGRYARPFEYAEENAHSSRRGLHQR